MEVSGLQDAAHSPTARDATDLQERVVQTLRLFSEWGHAASVGELREMLLGGPVDFPALRDALEDAPGLIRQGKYVGLRGDDAVLAETARRQKAHLQLEDGYLRVAHRFCHDLVTWCPFVQSVALTGSLASGGFAEGDDIDFDLFVESGTKYICYLLGILLGLKYAWAFRQREVHRNHQTPFLPKITCVNVIWPEDETRPFDRQDRAMAYELLRCRPLLGVERFEEVLEDNAWLWEHFPQLYQREWTEMVPNGDRNAVGRFFESLRRFPLALRIIEATCRGVSWIAYRFVQWTRRNDPEAVQRMKFLRNVKYPYEVFQD